MSTLDRSGNSSRRTFSVSSSRESRNGLQVGGTPPSWLCPPVGQDTRARQSWLRSGREPRAEHTAQGIAEIRRSSQRRPMCGGWHFRVRPAPSVDDDTALGAPQRGMKYNTTAAAWNNPATQAGDSSVLYINGFMDFTKNSALVLTVPPSSSQYYVVNYLDDYINTIGSIGIANDTGLEQLDVTFDLDVQGSPRRRVRTVISSRRTMVPVVRRTPTSTGWSSVSRRTP